MRRAALGAALTAVFVLGGCGEDQQVTVYKQGQYQGKPDTQPWSSAPPAAHLRGSTWNKGDRASWDAAITQRTMGQHEHKRIYNQ